MSTNRSISILQLLATSWCHILYCFYQDVLFTCRVSAGLLVDPKNRVAVFYRALQCHSGNSIACCYTLRGRLYFLKRPSQIKRVLTTKHLFEKLKSPKNAPLTKILGNAITTSGDDPVAWLAAKRSMRSSVHIPLLIPAFRAISQKLVEQAKDWTKRSSCVNIYQLSLRATTEASYQAFFGADLQAELKRRENHPYTIKNYIRIVDVFSNEYVAAKDEDVDGFSSFARDLCKDCLKQAPTGSFGAAIQGMVEDTDVHESFTLDMGIGNALFYVHALPVMASIVVHWCIYMLMARHPHHLHGIRAELDVGDRSYLRMCLKETLRLYHPAAFMARRAKQDIELDGTAISQGSLVIPFAKLIDVDLSFQPERWTGRASIIDEEIDDQNGIFYAPFAFGARSCLGKALVASVFEETVANLVHSFDFELLGEDPWNDKTAPALQHHPDMMIGFKPSRDLCFRVKECESR